METNNYKYNMIRFDQHDSNTITILIFFYDILSS